MGLKLWDEIGKNLTGACISLYFLQELETLFPLLAGAFLKSVHF